MTSADSFTRACPLYQHAVTRDRVKTSGPAGYWCQPSGRRAAIEAARFAATVIVVALLITFWGML
jgi:hypothetical protein